ncbi:hypothetical protein BCT23_02440 [Enterovibrio norvegicus]|uniref:Serine acetyltransferase n=2 Tax=Enterovibrio norvegicus TaxID=188144 RepID=A0A2N7LH89_9GAMM|nr:hypothetical protein BCT23_02440 [Enterovibrio norvegicus]
MILNTFIKSIFRSRICKKLKCHIEIMNWFHFKGYKHLAKYYERKIIYKYGCHIMPGVVLDSSTHLPHIVGIVIGRGVIIGKNVSILQNVTLGSSIGENLRGSDKTMPTIEDNVKIFSGAVVSGKITIGRNSFIGANATVTKNIPPNSLVVGFNIIKPLPEKFKNKNENL